MTKKGKHKTVRTELKQSIRWLESIDEISRVIINVSENCRHRYPPGHIKVRREVPGGAILSGYHGTGITNIFICVSSKQNREDVVKKIKEKYA